MAGTSFGEKLHIAMAENNLSQSQVVAMTKIPKSSISQYLSGKNEPSDERKQNMALLLGLHESYFTEETNEIPIIKIEPNGNEIKRMDIQDAARLLCMNHNTVRKGLQQGVFPWGYAIQTSPNRWVYFINAARFAAIEGITL